MTDYLTAADYARKLGISLSRVYALLAQGRIPGAIKPQRDWLIPAGAVPTTIDEGRGRGRRPTWEHESRR